MKPPALPVPAWVQTVTRADRRCECTGACGTAHGLPTVAGPEADSVRPPDAGSAVTVGRCGRGPGRPVVQIVAAPRDPSTPLAATWRLPVTDLAAWCPDCFSAAFRRHARARAGTAAAAPGRTDAQ